MDPTRRLTIALLEQELRDLQALGYRADPGEVRRVEGELKDCTRREAPRSAKAKRRSRWLDLRKRNYTVR